MQHRRRPRPTVLLPPPLQLARWLSASLGCPCSSRGWAIAPQLKCSAYLFVGCGVAFPLLGHTLTRLACFRRCACRGLLLQSRRCQGAREASSASACSTCHCGVHALHAFAALVAQEEVPAVSRRQRADSGTPQQHHRRDGRPRRWHQREQWQWCCCCIAPGASVLSCFVFLSAKVRPSQPCVFCRYGL